MTHTATDLEQKISRMRRGVQVHTNLLLNYFGSFSHGASVRISQARYAFQSLVAPEEQHIIGSGALYAAAAALVGSLLARNALNMLIFPPALAYITARQYLPQTTANARQRARDWERKNLPEIARYHDQAHASLASLRKAINYPKRSDSI